MHLLSDITWNIELPEPYGSRAKLQIQDIFKGICKPVFYNQDSHLQVIVKTIDDDSFMPENNDISGPDDHSIHTIDSPEGRKILIAGRTAKGALYGIFSFLEEIGFYFLASGFKPPESGVNTKINPIKGESSLHEPCINRENPIFY